MGWKELGLQNSYTMEASFCGADFGRRAERHFTVVQLEEMGHYFCDTILDYCDPDQSKVHSTLRELQALNPSNHSAHSGGSSNNNAEGGDSGGSGEEEPTVKTKVKSRQRRGSKKTSSSVSNGQAKSSEGGGKGIVGGNNGKKKRMRRRASLPAVGDGKGSKKSTSSNSTSNGKGKGSSSSASSKKDAKPPRKKELSVEEALAQADAVLSSLSVAQPPPRSRSSNNERIQQKKKKHGPQRPLSAGLLEEHYDTLSKLEKNHSKKESRRDRNKTSGNGSAIITKSGALRSSLAQAGKNALSGWESKNKSFCVLCILFRVYYIT